MTKEQEAIKKLTNGEKIDFNTLVRKFKREGLYSNKLEEFIEQYMIYYNK